MCDTRPAVQCFANRTIRSLIQRVRPTVFSHRYCCWTIAVIVCLLLLRTWLQATSSDSFWSFRRTTKTTKFPYVRAPHSYRLFSLRSWKMHEKTRMLTLTAALACCVRLSLAGSPTGVYMDNGVQTVKQDLMSVEERNEVEEEILTMFGVPKKPRKAPKNLDGSAPQFLFDVYRSIQQDGSHDRRPRSVSDVGQYDESTVQDSDVIITLYLSNHCEYY